MDSKPTEKIVRSFEKGVRSWALGVRRLRNSQLLTLNSQRFFLLLLLISLNSQLSTFNFIYAEVSKSGHPAPASKATALPAKEKFPSLWEIYKTLSSKKFVDLTHAFKPGIPKWKGYPDEKRKTLYNYRKDGFWAEEYTLVGQWGTHVDAPAHFHQGLRTVDEIPIEEMVAPLVLINLSEKAAHDPDTVVQLEDIKMWESKYGKIPEHSFVALRTDWSKRWQSLETMQNRDANGTMHYPGWGVEALKFLIKERNVSAIGHETTDTDAGFNVSVERYPAQTYVHGENRFQIELLTNLDQVPEYGALAIISFPKPEKGSGFPARVVAILP